jgi:hypothetical protein
LQAARGLAQCQSECRQRGSAVEAAKSCRRRDGSEYSGQSGGVETTRVAGWAERGPDPAGNLVAHSERRVEVAHVGTESLGVGKGRRNHRCTGVDGGTVLVDVGVVEIHGVGETAVEHRRIEQTVGMRLSGNGDPAARVEVVYRVNDRGGVLGEMTRECGDADPVEKQPPQTCHDLIRYPLRRCVRDELGEGPAGMSAGV